MVRSIPTDCLYVYCITSLTLHCFTVPLTIEQPDMSHKLNVWKRQQRHSSLIPGTVRSMCSPIVGTVKSMCSPIPGTVRSMCSPIIETIRSMCSPIIGTVKSMCSPIPGSKKYCMCSPKKEVCDHLFLEQ